jgi:hypothetical protein
MHLLFAPLLFLGQGGLHAAAQEEALQIVEPRRTYGHLGAVRPKAPGVLPGDIAYFTFGIKNLKLDDQGKALYSVGIEVNDDKGNLFYEQKPVNAVAQNFFGGNVLPCSANLSIPLDAPPGGLHWKVTVHDRLADRKVSLKGTGKILKPAFGLVRVGTFADPAAKVPVPPVGVVGGTLYIDFSAVGFMRDPDTKKPDLRVEMRVLDDKGQPTFAKALSGKVVDLPETVRLVPLQFGLTLNRPGRFTVQLTARCQHCGASDRVTLPVRILPLE